MIYDETGKRIDQDIQSLLDHFQYECSDYTGDLQDMEETCEAIQAFFATPIARGEVGRAVLSLFSVESSKAGPYKKQLARRVRDQIKRQYPDEYQQVKTFNRLRE